MALRQRRLAADRIHRRRIPHAATANAVMAKSSPIATAPRDGTLIRLWCHSETEPLIGYWSRAFIGWVSYTEDVPLIREVSGRLDKSHAAMSSRRACRKRSRRSADKRSSARRDLISEMCRRCRKERVS
jgi:hypothetical protein